ncbi:MAG: hypothetical protein WC291_00270 [Thermodesulfovibrionales bacterium]|jgi:general stress protein 26
MYNTSSYHFNDKTPKVRIQKVNSSVCLSFGVDDKDTHVHVDMFMELEVFRRLILDLEDKAREFVKAESEKQFDPKKEGHVKDE